MEEYNQVNKNQENMALVSLIMGIIGIVSSCCCFSGLIFGILGIVFAVLSRVDGRFEGYSKGGLITSIVALCLAFLIAIIRIFILGLGMLSY